MTHARLALITCLLTLGCDSQDQAAAQTAGKDAKAPTTATTATTATTKDAGPGASAGASAPAGGGDVKFDGLSSCLLSCEAADKIPTNRETCKLNCDAAYGSQAGEATPRGSDPVDTAVSCLGRCYASEAGPDACATGCKSAAVATPMAPATAVIDQLATCVQTCHADKSSLPTNRATCELNCAQAARVAGPAAR